MTCREKVAKSTPHLVNDIYIGGVMGCPSRLKNARELCDGIKTADEKLCRECWNQEYVEKPPLGVQPAFIAYQSRICDLCDGIKRMAEDGTTESYNKASEYVTELKSLITHSLVSMISEEEDKRQNEQE